MAQLTGVQRAAEARVFGVGPPSSVEVSGYAEEIVLVEGEWIVKATEKFTIRRVWKLPVRHDGASSCFAIDPVSGDLLIRGTTHFRVGRVGQYYFKVDRPELLNTAPAGLIDALITALKVLRVLTHLANTA